jgi:hypothetical protein
MYDTEQIVLMVIIRVQTFEWDCLRDVWRPICFKNKLSNYWGMIFIDKFIVTHLGNSLLLWNPDIKIKIML